MDTHNASVSTISSSIQAFSALQQPFRIYHGSTNSTRDSRRDASRSVDTSALDHVLRVDPEARVALVEPNVPMDALLAATLARSLVPLVVMEFPGITVGGGFSGTSGESSSFRHGFFDGTVNWVEMVLATGEVVRASREERADLFWGAASSFGTLGVVTMLEVRLRRAEPWVRLTLTPFAGMGAAVAAMEASLRDPGVDYLDGIVYARDRVVVCTGVLAGAIPRGAEVRRFTRRADPWFYLYAQRRTRAEGSRAVTLYVPIADYLFRYDRGAFWVARYAFRYFVTPFNRVTRFLLDRFMRTRVMYHALHESGQSRIYVIQDVAIPLPHAGEFHDWLDDSFGIYPIWLCPLRQRREGPGAEYGLYGQLAHPETPEFVLNFGVWGPGSRNRLEFIRQNRELEAKVGELGGRKWLYAHAYYTEEEFWGIYDRRGCEALREKYGAGYLPSVYDKVKVDLEAEDQAGRATWLAWFVYLFWSIWPLSGLYGVYKAWMGGDYLLQKRSKVPVLVAKRE